MIIDKIENVNKYYNLSKDIEKGLKFITETDFSKYSAGKYEIDGDNMYFSITEYETKDKEDTSFEGHIKYIDIQYVIKGKEAIGYAPINDLKTLIEYDETKDMARYTGRGDFLLADNSRFFIFYPQDGHMPCVSFESKDNIRKVIVKIKC